jgi:hypothetical protein
MVWHQNTSLSDPLFTLKDLESLYTTLDYRVGQRKLAIFHGELEDSEWCEKEIEHLKEFIERVAKVTGPLS